MNERIDYIVGEFVGESDNLEQWHGGVTDEQSAMQLAAGLKANNPALRLRICPVSAYVCVEEFGS